MIEPRELEGLTECVYALAVVIDGKVYSGSCDKTIRVWSGTDGTQAHGVAKVQKYKAQLPWRSNGLKRTYRATVAPG